MFHVPFPFSLIAFKDQTWALYLYTTELGKNPWKFQKVDLESDMWFMDLESDMWLVQTNIYARI